jgi:hypothetical protein
MARYRRQISELNRNWLSITKKGTIEKVQFENEQLMEQLNNKNRIIDNLTLKLTILEKKKL